MRLLAHYPIFATTEPALDRFDQLVRLKLNVGKMDLKIAAVALELDATVVTDNAIDFGRVPGLKWEDWTV
ncbi:type II toxin-antitoxin system VapC family toxin [Gemmata sp.]|uniref:type II toxin-antitoxin system VapC family toxin n=1 Tax=Gemmata sp. TaxID=1914242 RepID=UPI003F72D08C